VIYHEGARYQVVSVALPPSQPGKDGTVTTTARRCAACGYLHAEAVGIDTCENEGCGQLLGKTTRDLLRLTTVRTQRRDRISSDEEERRRSGFELQTAYRFAQHGAKPGRIDATVVSDDQAGILTLAYGDSATIRKTNVGRRRRVNAEVQGYLIDVTTAAGSRRTRRTRPPRKTAWRRHPPSGASSGSSPTWRTAGTSSSPAFPPRLTRDRGERRDRA